MNLDIPIRNVLPEAKLAIQAAILAGKEVMWRGEEADRSCPLPRAWEDATA